MLMRSRVRFSSHHQPLIINSAVFPLFSSHSQLRCPSDLIADRLSPLASFSSTGGGDLKVVSQKLEWKASSRVRSLDNVKHKAGGGQVQIFDEKFNRSPRSSSQIRSQTPAAGREAADSASAQEGKKQADSAGKPALPPKPAARKASNGSNDGNSRPAS